MPPDKLIEGIRDVLDGGAPMTPSVARKVLKVFRHQSFHIRENRFELTSHEIEILSMLTQEMNYKMIAAAVNTSFHTMNSHLKNIRNYMFTPPRKRCKKLRCKK